jgi:hypothetical protein
MPEPSNHGNELSRSPSTKASVGSWFRRTAADVDGAPPLRVYAVLLSLLHVLTAVAWITYKRFAELVTGEDCVCWPLFADCHRLRPYLTPTLAYAALATYAALGLTSAVLFARRRPRAALATFLLATAIGSSLYALDYRLRLNQTYMFGWVVIVLLLAPRKAAALQVLVALFYFWAGTLKLGTEWTSGAALYAKPLLVPDALVPASCIYVLVLELVLVWGLFAPQREVRFAVYAQLVLFHAVSWSVVGYFYPLLMLGLTSIYPLVWSLTPDESVTVKMLRSERASWRSAASVAALFTLFQLVPRLFPGDTAVTGEGRLFALHMFDARVECRGAAVVTRPAGRSRAALIDDQQDARTRCDPIAIAAQAQRLCRLLAARGDDARVDVAIDAKRTTDPEMKPLLHVDDFCRRDTTYSVWHHNAWIGGPP